MVSILMSRHQLICSFPFSDFAFFMGALSQPGVQWEPGSSHYSTCCGTCCGRGCAALSAKMASQTYWEAGDAFSPEEVSRAKQLLCSRETPDNDHSFTEVVRDQESEWLYQKMITIALRADLEAGWGLLNERTVVAVDNLIYDRFGPRCKHPSLAARSWCLWSGSQVL